MLKLKPSTQVIGKKKTDCYGVFFGDHEIEKVPALRYKDAAKYGFGVGYIYSHVAKDAYQQFMPDELVDRKYLS